MTGTHISSTHPQLPPTTEEQRFSWLRLLRSRRVGIATFHRLMREFGSAEAALEALPDIAREAGETNYQACDAGRVKAELAAGAAAGAQLVAMGEPDYPRRLAEIGDAPPLLWMLGDRKLANSAVIAMVGARNASSLGQRMARALARDLGKAGFVIVSGLARGIDTSAHQVTIDTGSIAVMAGGVDVIYPAENAQLAEKLATHGLRLSEQPVGTIPQARHFPNRNRIISGMACAVIVVEAAGRSGSLITARDALDQGRDVLAVPGHPFDARASGCNMLIRDGASLVRSAEDVIEVIGEASSAKYVHTPTLTESVLPKSPISQHSAPRANQSLRDTSELHMQILNRLGPAPLAEDQLIRDLSSTPSQVTPALVDLEVEGRIVRQAGGLLALS